MYTAFPTFYMQEYHTSIPERSDRKTWKTEKVKVKKVLDLAAQLQVIILIIRE